MTGKELFFELGNIDAVFISAAAPREKRRSFVWRVLPAFACVTLVVGALLALVVYDTARRNDPYDDMIWAEDLYTEVYGNNEMEPQAYGRWELAITKQYDGYRMSYTLFDSFLHADDDDIFAIVVTDGTGDPYGTQEYADIFLDVGVSCEIINGQLFIFVGKEEFFNMDLNESEKDLFVFVCASSAYFQKFGR